MMFAGKRKVRQLEQRVEDLERQLLLLIRFVTTITENQNMTNDSFTESIVSLTKITRTLV